MDNTIAAFGLAATSSTSRSSADTANNASPIDALPASPSSGVVERNRDLPATSQVSEINNPSDVGTNRSSRAEERADPATQQKQIESYLAEQTGESAETFQGIDIQTALDLQESFRNRPAQDEQVTASAAQQNTEQPVDANDQQSQELQQRLQSRLAEQIPNDPGTEFPQLIETVA